MPPCRHPDAACVDAQRALACRALAVALSLGLNGAWLLWVLSQRPPLTNAARDDAPLQIVWLAPQAPRALLQVRAPEARGAVPASPRKPRELLQPQPQPQDRSHRAAAPAVAPAAIMGDDSWAPPTHGQPAPPGAHSVYTRRGVFARPGPDLVAVEPRVRIVMRGGASGTCAELRRLLNGGAAGMDAAHTSRDAIARTLIEDDC